VFIRTNRTAALKLGGALIIVVSILLASVSRPIRFLDDAWITFRYAHHLAYNGQLTFNLNERVEGITNLLWAVILGVQMRLVPAPIEVIVAYSSLFLITLSLVRVWQIGLLLGLRPILAALPSALIVLSPDFYGTVTNGLEAALFGALLSEALCWFVRGRPAISSALFGLLFLTRPESIVIGFIFLAIFLRPSIQPGETGKAAFRLNMLERRQSRLTTVVSIAAFPAIVTAATAWRWWYFGKLIPNSLQAKLYEYSWDLLEAGLEYVVSFSRGNLPLLVILPAALFFVFAGRKSTVPAAAEIRGAAPETSHQLALLCVLSILYSLAVPLRSGGDWMPNSRLLTQYGVLYAVLLLLILQRMARPGSLPDRSRAIVVASVLLLLMPLVQTLSLSIGRLRAGAPPFELYHAAGYPFWRETAARLAQAPLTPSDVVSSEGIGYISYVLIDTYMHDPLGLTDEHLARAGKDHAPFGKMDVQYTVERIRPSVMIWHYAGQLRKLDASAVDSEYVTYCYSRCDTWSADVVMIRRDRAGQLSSYFEDWKNITISELYSVNP